MVVYNRIVVLSNHGIFPIWGAQNGVCYRTGTPTLGRAQFRKPKRLKSFEKNDNTIEDLTTWGVGARNLGDPATGRPAKYNTFGPTLAPFPGERRGPFAQRTTLSGNRRYGWRPGR